MAETQQPSGPRDAQDPYPADQQFGEAAAKDQERADAGDTGGSGRDAPRAANKAEPVEGEELPAEAGADTATGEAPTG